jgi:hypothetical protein
MAGIHCTIVVAGELSERFEGAFAELALTRSSGATELSGDLVDQSAFQGVLHQVADLGLDIVSLSVHSGDSPEG